MQERSKGCARQPELQQACSRWPGGPHKPGGSNPAASQQPPSQPGSRTSWISFMQPSKSVSMDSTSAPLAMGCTSCAREILSAGRNTIEGMPAGQGVGW